MKYDRTKEGTKIVYYWTFLSTNTTLAYLQKYKHSSLFTGSVANVIKLFTAGSYDFS